MSPNFQKHSPWKTRLNSHIFQPKTGLVSHASVMKIHVSVRKQRSLEPFRCAVAARKHKRKYKKRKHFFYLRFHPSVVATLRMRLRVKINVVMPSIKKKTYVQQVSLSYRIIVMKVTQFCRVDQGSLNLMYRGNQILTGRFFRNRKIPIFNVEKLTFFH